MATDFNGAKNLLEFKETEQQELFAVQRSKALYKIKDYENLVGVCKALRQRIPAFHPKLVIYNNGSLRNWVNTIWAIGSYFEYQYKYSVCIVGDIQCFSHFLKSGEIKEEKIAIGSGESITVFKTSANVTILNITELRALRARCETVQEFEDLYQRITDYFQMMIVAVKNRLSGLKREDIHKVIFLNSNSVAYTLQLKNSTHGGFNTIRDFFKKYDLNESGVFLEQE